MQIILDNIVYSLQKAGGISVYWSELLSRIPKGIIADTIDYKNENIHKTEAGWQSNSHRTKFLISLKRYLSVRIANKDVLFHSSYYRLAKGKNIKNIITIHDFTFEKFLSNRKGAFLHIKQKRNGILNSDGIICVSNNTKRDLLKMFPTVDESKIKVIYNGVNEYFKNNQPLYIDPLERKDDKYILFIGSRVSYKNFDKAVEVVSRKIDTKLFIVGESLNKNELELLNSCIPNRYKFYGNVTTSQLKHLYRNAFCLLYPSSYEGFGIPIIEAMCSSCPVIALNKSSIPEVAGNAALLIDDPNPELIISKLELLEERDYRNSVIKKGVIQGAKFSWDKMAKETINFYKEIYER